MFTPMYFPGSLPKFLKSAVPCRRDEDFATHTDLAGSYEKDGVRGKFLIRDHHALFRRLSCSYAEGQIFNLTEKPNDRRRFFLDIEDKESQFKFTQQIIQAHLIQPTLQVMHEVFDLHSDPAVFVARNDKFEDYKVHAIFHINVTKKQASMLTDLIKRRLDSRGVGKYIDSSAKSLRMLGALKVVRNEDWSINMDESRARGIYLPTRHYQRGFYLVKEDYIYPLEMESDSEENLLPGVGVSRSFRHHLTPQSFADYSIFPLTGEDATLKPCTYFYKQATEEAVDHFDDFLDTVKPSTVRSVFRQMINNLPLKWAVNFGTWSIMAKACYDVLGTEGLDVFITFSKRSEKHRSSAEAECRQKFAMLERGDDDSEQCEQDVSDDEDDHEESNWANDQVDVDEDVKEDDSPVGSVWRRIASVQKNRALLGYDYRVHLKTDYAAYMQQQFQFPSIHHNIPYVSTEDIKTCLPFEMVPVQSEIDFGDLPDRDEYEPSFPTQLHYKPLPADHRAMLIQAPMGAGKTTAIIQYLKETRATFLWIVPRCAHGISVFNSVAAEGLDAVYYSNVKSPNIIQSCVIQWESLHRIFRDEKHHPAHFDVVIVDEIESLYQQATSTTTNASHIDTNVHIFEQYIMNSPSRLILADAFLQKRTMDMLGSRSCPYQVHSYTGNVVQRKAKMYPFPGNWRQELKTALASEKKLFIFFSSLTEMQRMLAEVSDEIRAKSMVYSSKHGNVNMDESIDDQWSNYQFIWTTSTITVGCSCMLDTFDDIFVFHTNRSCVLSRDVMQALYRVRKIRGDVHLHIDNTYPNRVRRLPIDELHMVRALVKRMDSIKAAYEDADMYSTATCDISIESLAFRFCLIARTELAVNTQMFVDYFLDLMMKAGYIIHWDQDALIPREEKTKLVIPAFSSVRDASTSEIVSLKQNRSVEASFRLLKYSFREKFRSDMPDDVRERCWEKYAKESTYKHRVDMDHLMHTTQGPEQLRDRSVHLVNSNQLVMKYQMHRAILAHFSTPRHDDELKNFVEQNADRLRALDVNLMVDPKSGKNKYKIILDSFLERVSFDVIGHGGVQKRINGKRVRSYESVIERADNDKFGSMYIRHEYSQVDDEYSHEVS